MYFDWTLNMILASYRKIRTSINDTLFWLSMYTGKTYISNMKNISVIFFSQAYKSKRSFIATQMPLKDTVVDFWRLLYEQQVSTIVMLNQLGSDKPKEVQHVNIKIYLFMMYDIDFFIICVWFTIMYFMILIANSRYVRLGFFQFNIQLLRISVTFFRKKILA